MEKQSNAVLEMAKRNQVFSAHGRHVCVMDSVSFADERDAGHVMVTGSHGGHSAGEYAARILPLVSVCSDAGIGKNRAGVAGLKDLDGFGVIGLGVSHVSARIGDGMDIWDNGILSYVNDHGIDAGFVTGTLLREALRDFLETNPAGVLKAAGGHQEFAPMERAQVAQQGGRRIVTMDSISIIHPEDRGQIIIAGSNGGTASGEVALRVKPAFVALNDAGIGKDGAGIAGLIQMDEAGIPGVGISHESAEISSGRDMWAGGIVSFVNASARLVGILQGMSLREAVSTLTEKNS